MKGNNNTKKVNAKKNNLKNHPLTREEFNVFSLIQKPS